MEKWIIEEAKRQKELEEERQKREEVKWRLRQLEAELQKQIQEAEKQKQAENEISLVSAKGVDYTKLRDLLAAGNWKEADEETGRVILKVAGRESEGWLRYEDAENFSCQDLGKIDKLWVIYSNGKFGFSVQKQILKSLGGTRIPDQQVWDLFGDQVGWRKEGKWLKSGKERRYGLNLLMGGKNNQKGYVPMETLIVLGKGTDGWINGGGLVWFGFC